MEAARSLDFILPNRLVGNAIAPYHGALMLVQLQRALSKFTGYPLVNDLARIVKSFDDGTQGFHDLIPVAVQGFRTCANFRMLQRLTSASLMMNQASSEAVSMLQLPWSPKQPLASGFGAILSPFR